jgi:hypothetical protein
MVAVVVGALLYDAVSALVARPALRLALHNGLFLLTLLAMASALRTLALLPDERPESISAPSRPGYREVGRALAAVWRYPAFFWQMWLQCLASAAALFAVYTIQSPLSRLATGLARAAPQWWPLYTAVATVGYWASSQGSRAFRAHHERPRPAAAPDAGEGRTAVTMAISSVLLLALYPLMYLARPLLGERAPLLLAAALVSLLFNYLRGFVEPASATALIDFSRAQCMAVPVSLVSGWNSIKRGVHFGLSALFFLAQQQAKSVGAAPDAVLSRTLGAVSVALAILAVPALLLLRRPAATSPAPS